MTLEHAQTNLKRVEMSRPVNGSQGEWDGYWKELLHATVRVKMETLRMELEGEDALEWGRR
jgi:hypothetical protein